MNKIYKSIWNAVTRSWTAVSECQKSRGKQAKRNVSFFVISLLVSSFSVSQAIEIDGKTFEEVIDYQYETLADKPALYPEPEHGLYVSSTGSITDNFGKIFTIKTDVSSEKRTAFLVEKGASINGEGTKFEVTGSIEIRGSITGSNLAFRTTENHYADIEIWGSNDNLYYSEFKTDSSGDIIIHDVFSLGRTPTVSVGKGRLVFSGVDGSKGSPVPFDGNVIAQGVDLKEGSTVIYGARATFSGGYDSVNPTAMVGTSIYGDGITLEVSNLSQLGKELIFLDADAEDPSSFSRVIVPCTLSDNGQYHIIGDSTGFRSDYEQTLIVFQGMRYDIEFVLNNKQQWDNYKGWLRFEDGKFDLTQSAQMDYFGRMGLSVGKNATINVDENGLSIDRFGWSSASSALSSININTSAPDDTAPALTVNELWIEGGGSIRFDPSSWLSTSTGQIPEGQSVLDYQMGTPSVLLFK